MDYKIIRMDKSGILPKLNESQDSFYERGNRFLEAAYAFKNKTDNKVSKEFLDFVIEMFGFDFDTKPSLITCYTKKINKPSKKKVRAITLGQVVHKEERGQIIPVVEIDEESLEKGMNLIETLKHEFTHAIRRPLEEISSNSNEVFAYFLSEGEIYKPVLKVKTKGELILDSVTAGISFLASPLYFEEGEILFGTALTLAGAIASYCAFDQIRECRRTRKLYRNLGELNRKNWGIRGTKMGYSLLRMTKEEVSELNRQYKEKNYNSFIKFVKSKVNNDLRFKIMAERLG
ncbi:MAG: hypothetical protein AABX99_03710 [Nanoarchaeota archaeon]